MKKISICNMFHSIFSSYFYVKTDKYFLLSHCSLVSKEPIGNTKKQQGFVFQKISEKCDSIMINSRYTCAKSDYFILSRFEKDKKQEITRSLRVTLESYT